MQIDVRMAQGAEPVGHDGMFTGAPAGLASGANVRVPGGWRRVENLRRGDLIVTRDDGLQPIRLIWTQRVSAAEMIANPALMPVRLTPRAVGPMMPRRDVLLGGGQRVLVPAWRVAGNSDGHCRMIEARELAGRSDGAFMDMSAAGVTFHVLVLDCPQVVQVEGLPVESFVANAGAIMALDEDRRTDLLRLFPELERAPSCYPPARYGVAAGRDYRPA